MKQADVGGNGKKVASPARPPRASRGSLARLAVKVGEVVLVERFPRDGHRLERLPGKAAEVSVAVRPPSAKGSLERLVGKVALVERCPRDRHSLERLPGKAEEEQAAVRSIQEADNLARRPEKVEEDSVVGKLPEDRDNVARLPAKAQED